MTSTLGQHVGYRAWHVSRNIAVVDQIRTSRTVSCHGQFTGFLGWQEVQEPFRCFDIFAALRNKGTLRNPDRQAIFSTVAGLGKETYIIYQVEAILLDRCNSKGQHWVMHTLTGGHHPYPVFQHSRTEVFMQIAGLIDFLQAGKTTTRGRRGCKLCFVIRKGIREPGSDTMIPFSYSLPSAPGSSVAAFNCSRR
ncbi:hypothetical protein [Yoonia sediminilitoris]|uniref:Uncharacterized protein n=1 Tax=Yoonia sediminilitoris TaxID=1286148 RepID=A0A2T6KG51_9RHOB|nr:hypothetical protein [Yoonia sediminilitoris]PUB14291.1 hypothetical protein C8N45_106165 [Yoonia sediminilitoris]RCW95222.1 hypothetical protein DFP92_106165 [Yoonia sediminilitoris]